MPRTIMRQQQQLVVVVVLLAAAAAAAAAPAPTAATAPPTLMPAPSSSSGSSSGGAAKHVVPAVTAKEAWALISAAPAPADTRTSRWLYLDVRTRGEFQAGHPPGAVNVPVMNVDAATGKRSPNPSFVHDVEAAVGGGDDKAKLVVGCHSGVRSAVAVQLLAPRFAPGTLLEMPGSWLEWEASKLPIEKGLQGAAAAVAASKSKQQQGGGGGSISNIKSTTTQQPAANTHAPSQRTTQAVAAPRLQLRP